MNTIFVYGTLRKKGHNHHILSSFPNIQYLGQGTTKDPYTLIGLTSGSYPYAFPSPIQGIPQIPISGEVYSIPKDQLQHLDAFEYNYTRTTTAIQLNNTTIQAYIYILANPTFIGEIEQNRNNRFTPIISGDWIAHLNKSS
jgi:gamma-glutamylcyclotransferase (GGCT)/AIG2-like uncharacterized protein YtfP